MTATLKTWLHVHPPDPHHRPWPRYRLDRDAWRALVAELAVADWSLLGLWGTPGEVHIALRDESAGEIAVASLRCPEGRFPAVSPVRPAAQRLERMLHDLDGLTAEGAVDARPWLDHGTWRESARGGVPRRAAPTDYAFRAVEGEGLHQIPVGPVHAGIIEPGHFRFHASGETVARLEARLGYVHKGTQRLMEGRTVRDAARLAGRISGDSTVAHALAFARAVEAAAGIEAPPRAVWLRGIMAEVERLANHFGDIGAICNDAAFAFMHAQCMILREDALRVAASSFGHRLMMDCVIPGGVGVDLTTSGVATIRGFLKRAPAHFARLVPVYDGKTSLADRTVGTGVTASSLVRRFGAGGYIGRAASRGIDARRMPGYPPYDELEFEVPVLAEGDVNARIWVRIREVEASFALLQAMLDRLPQGPVAIEVPARPGEGMALVEAFRGEIMTWVRLGPSGLVARAMPRDPSWFQWPLLEAAIEGNIVADFPLCNKSFNCSYSGHDL